MEKSNSAKIIINGKEHLFNGRELVHLTYMRIIGLAYPGKYTFITSREQIPIHSITYSGAHVAKTKIDEYNKKEDGILHNGQIVVCKTGTIINCHITNNA
jgi:hypothetical protein